jgi:hypothetical protein
MSKTKNISNKRETKRTSSYRTIKSPAKPSTLDPLLVDEAIKKIAAQRIEKKLSTRSKRYS